MVKLKFKVASPEQIAEWIFNEFRQAIIGNPEGVAGQLIFINFSDETKQKIRMNSQLTYELKKR